MTSGQMWNHIRGPPPMGRSGRGVAFIAGSSQQQYIFETYWVAIMYAATSLAVILMGDHAADTSKDNDTRRNLGFTGVLLFAFSYSLILATFRQKYQGYPYGLFF